MTEQEYKAKQNELKQVRQNISDLGKRENELRREIAKHEAIQYKDKYYHDFDDGSWLKPIQISGEFIYFISISMHHNIDTSIPEYFVEEVYYDVKYIGEGVKEVSEEEFRNGVNEIMLAAQKTIFGDDV